MTKTSIILLLTGLGSASALAAAFIAQYVFHFAPCHLCILQRYPHAAVAAIALSASVALLRRKRCGAFATEQDRPPNVRLLGWALLVCGLLLLAGFGIAAYHTGVEQRWFPGPSGCTSTSTGNESIEQMRRELMNAPLVSCDQPLGDVLGIGLPEWSAAIYAFLMLLAFYGVYCSYRPQRTA